MTQALPMQDNRHHAAVATANRNRSIPIQPSRGPMISLGNPAEVPFDPRAKPFRILDCLGSAIVCVATITPLVILFWSGLK